MITKINIENFKSIQSLELDLGRLNILIGANGSGKSNLLEAIAIGSAAMENKLDDEFLANRGIRVAEPEFMKARFEKNNQSKPISIEWSNEKGKWPLEIFSKDVHFNKWEIKGGIKEEVSKKQEEIKGLLIKGLADSKLITDIENSGDDKGDEIFAKAILKALSEWIEETNGKLFEDEKIKRGLPFFTSLVEMDILEETDANEFLNFIIYAPENHFLRRFEEEASIKPLGIKGEGLFKLITIIETEYPTQFEEIKKYLKLVDWFKDFQIPDDLKFTEKKIKIKDQYLSEDFEYLDQRSANEGFLYLLFYLTLFISELTPHFFAIDNIDNSLNPKLGSELIKILAQLSKSHHKQTILTTHNPVILDGIDLTDDDQRLFVVYRNANGHTKIRRILPKQLNEVNPVRLSEAFIRGYIGGIPKNF